MSVYVNWELTAWHKNDSKLTEAEATAVCRALQAMPPMRDAVETLCDGWEVTFETASHFAVSDMKEQAAQFTADHPECVLHFTYQYDTALCPDGFRAQDGRIREFTGTVVYTWDDDGKEVAP